MDRVKHPQKLSRDVADLGAFAVSFVVLFDGWPDDLVRLHASLQCCSAAWEMVVVDNPVDDEASERITALDGVYHIPLREKVGFGAGRNLGIRLAAGEIVCVVDTSVEITGDVVEPIASHLADPGIGLVGRWGVSTDDGYDFAESDGPDVDGVEGYLMAFRRDDLERIGSFDAKFRFYRNADLDFTYRVRDAGLHTIVDHSLPVVRHEHRLWENTPDRDEQSRKNFFRFRNRWY